MLYKLKYVSYTSGFKNWYGMLKSGFIIFSLFLHFIFWSMTQNKHTASIHVFAPTGSLKGTEFNQVTQSTRGAQKIISFALSFK